MVKGYSVFIQYDIGDDIYIASVPELKGCMAHGDTPEKALKEIAVAQKLWIESAAKHGEKVPEPALYAS